MKTKIHLGSRTHAFPSQILHLEAYDNYTQIHFTDGTTLLSSTSLGVIEKRLTDFNFFRINRGTVVNLDYLTDFDLNKQTVRVSKIYQGSIPVSRRRTKPLLKALENNSKLTFL